MSNDYMFIYIYKLYTKKKSHNCIMRHILGLHDIGQQHPLFTKLKPTLFIHNR